MLAITKSLVILKCVCLCLLAMSCAMPDTVIRVSAPPVLKTASTHPMKYYLSLPDGWAAGKKWPVVVIIESADRDFLQAGSAFAHVRVSYPFILVTPLVVTNGGAGYRDVPSYQYSDEVWARIQKDGDFKFDMDGINAVTKDVVRDFGAEDKFFITGLEAGGHTVWAIVFNHPEKIQAAALVCPNYLGRWIDETQISSAAERETLPISVLVGTKDDLCSPGKPIYTQIEKAMSVANTHGYTNVSLTRVEGKGHERLPEEVLAYFSSLMQH